MQSDIDTMGTTVEISQKNKTSLGDTQPLKSQYTGGWGRGITLHLIPEWSTDQVSVYSGLYNKIPL